MFSKERITPAMLLGKQAKKKGLPDFKKLRKVEFEKWLGFDSKYEESEGDSIIDPTMLAKFNTVE
jgi:hypothetical protein